MIQTVLYTLECRQHSWIRQLCCLLTVEMWPVVLFAAPRAAASTLPRLWSLVTLTMSSSTSASPVSASSKALVVDPFCTVFDVPIRDFEAAANAQYSESALRDGYAPFCKHLFIENFTNAQVNVLPITPQNESLLRTKYEARNEKELPVLTRFFPKELVGDGDGHSLPVAKYLDLILYSREQINAENASQGRVLSGGDPVDTAPWGIVSIKTQDVDYELPMTPITAMRNALGKEEGGSGVPLNREEYMKAVNYWKDHATVS
jgi:Protein of unknown function (DUF3228)